jgi:hypothetical protein
VSKHLSPERNERGAQGERAVQDWLVQLYGLESVTYAGDELQKSHIDYVVIPRAEPSFRVEVKTDQYIERTGNVAVEVFRMKHDVPQNKRFYPSWFINSDADFLAVYSPVSSLLYVLDMYKTRDAVNVWVKEKRGTFEMKVVAAYTDPARTSFNVLMPISELVHDRWQYNSDVHFWEQAVAA